MDRDCEENYVDPLFKMKSLRTIQFEQNIVKYTNQITLSEEDTEISNDIIRTLIKVNICFL